MSVLSFEGSTPLAERRVGCSCRLSQHVQVAAALCCLIAAISSHHARAAGCEPVPSGLVSWWTGENTAADREGSNDGVLQAGATASATGLVGWAFDFNGTTAYVQIPDSSSLRPSVFTIEAWVRFDSLDSTLSGPTPPGRQYIVFKQNTRNSIFEGFNLYKHRSGSLDYFIFGVSSASGQIAEVRSSISIATHVWYHIAGVRTATAIQFYVNGQLQGEANANFAQDYGDFPLYFGTTGQSFWDGKLAGELDEVSLFDRPLSAVDISAIFAAGAAGKCFGLSILSQPQSQTHVLGETAVFAVSGSGDPPISYQWLFDDQPIPGATDTNLVLSNLQATNAGNYSVVLTNPNQSITSTVATLTVLLPPVISLQPHDATNRVGSTTFLSSSASGTSPLSYRWLFNGSALLDSGRITGAASDTLQISAVEIADAGNYSLVVSNVAGVVTSVVASLTIMAPPEIGTQPSNSVVTLGTPAFFAVSATGTQPLTYQWYRENVVLSDGGNISGSTSPGLNLLSAQSEDAGGYYVVVSNSEGSITSQVAVLSIYYPPAILTQPHSSTNKIGSTAIFSSSASGTSPLSFRWRLNGSALLDGGRITGSTSDTLQINAVEIADSGNYSLVVSNVAGVVTSVVASLTITVPPGIGTQPSNTVVTAGTPAFFAVSATGTRPLTYQWFRENAALSDGGNISGSTSPSLNLLSAQPEDAGGYYVVVSNSEGSITSQVAVLSISYMPVILTQPASQAAKVTTNVNFSVSVAGTPPFAYQWMFDGNPLSDGGQVSGSTTSNLLLTFVLIGNAGNYSVIVTNGSGSVTSSPAALTVHWSGECAAAPPGLVGWWPGDGSARDIIGTNNGTLMDGATATTNGVTGLAFDFDGTNKYVRIEDAPELKPTNLTVVCWVMFDNLDAPGTSVYVGQQYLVFKQNSRFQDFEGYVLSKDRTHADIILWEVTSSSGELIRIDSVSAVTTNVWYHLAAVRGSNYISLYFNGQLEAQATVDFPQDYGDWPLYFGTSGQDYYDRRLNGKLDEVMLFNRALSAEEIAVLFGSGPAGSCKGTNGIIIDTQPQNQAVIPGQSVAFSVEAIGLGPMNYQWRRNGIALPGATNSVLDFTNVQASDQGQYQVLINDVSGSVLSTAATLTVLGRPGLSDPHLTVNGHFGLKISGVAGSVYVVEHSTNLANWAEIGTVTNTTGQVDFIDPSLASDAFRFYRARLIP